MSKYKIVSADDWNEWDTYIDSSPQGTIFSKSTYLKCIRNKILRFYVAKGEEIKGAMVAVISECGSKLIEDDLVIYNGIIFSANKTKKESKARTERFEITQTVIEELLNRYSEVNITLSPHFEDIRPFLWHNYHSNNIDEKFIVDVKYTSYIDISELKSSKSDEELVLFKNLDTLRQRNIREAKLRNIKCRRSNNVDLLISFYTDLMKSQSEIVKESKLTTMKNLCSTLLNDKSAELFEVINEKNEIIYLALFCFDEKRAYYLFGAGNIETNERYKGTIVFWEAFKYLSKSYNVHEVDLEGVNSPLRGWFKLSFGGNLLPYFQIKMKDIRRKT